MEPSVTHFLVRFLLNHLRAFLEHAFHTFALGAAVLSDYGC